jgi:hypothetical protein
LKIPSEMGHKLCGILSVAWSDGYKSLEDFAKALERVAADARVLHARQQAEEGGTRLIG